MTIETKVTFETLSARIALITQSERVTRNELGNLSREVLAYVLETEDVRPINTLLSKGEDGKYILTAVNRRAANLYFAEFTPFSTNGAKEGEVLQFVKKKAKVWDKYVAKIEEFLANELNNIWSWTDENVQMEPKPAQYDAKITKLIAKALSDEVDGISKGDVLLSVMAAGISIDDLLALAGSMAGQAA